MEEMVQQGLLEEVGALLDLGFGPAWPAHRTLGYPEAVRRLRGEIDAAEMIATIQTATRRFAKRQMTWFRSSADIEWLDVVEGGEDELVATIAGRLRSAPPTVIPPA